MANELQTLLQQLQTMSNSRNDTKNNGDASAATLVQAKIQLAQRGLLLPGSQESHSKNDIQTARDILSYGALLSVQKGDIAGFTRYLSQLKTFWERKDLSTSDLQQPLTGLALLRLLAANDIAGFHTMLEELAATTSFDQLMNDKYTKFPLDLERWLMEGSYSKVWSARASSPLPENQIFLDQLIQTVRNEIASCGERAYTSLPLHDAAVLLFFQNREELLQFASQRKGWTVNPTAEVITFEGTVGDERDEASKAELPKERVVDTILSYARELETIV